jgi:sigma-54 dependent transcriptional regulator, acetoin dehydrogenase operon transcriptional activator AcoR
MIRDAAMLLAAQSGMSGQTTARLEHTDCETAAETQLRFVAIHGKAVGDGLLSDGMVVGRSPECTLQIEAHGVSREQAQVLRQGPLWVIRDLNSTNGTYVQGRRAHHAPLQAGAIVRIGDGVLLVTRGGSSASEIAELASGLIAGPEMALFLEPLRRAAPTDLPVVVTGATGTGKERVARAVHQWSGRIGPFHAINCAAIPANMAEAELFGYRKGAFTGASYGHDGHLRSASEGTLFLDEVAELPLEVQAKLLRALEDHTVTPLGESRALPVNFRVICATHSSLNVNVASGRFREDLAARLNGISVDLLPLRERPADMVSLFRYFLVRETHGYPPAIDGRLVEALCLYAWPQNIRELELLTKRLVALHGAAASLKRAHLPPEIVQAVIEVTHDDAAFSTRDEQDLHRVLLALRDTGGNVKQAAKQAGVSRQRVYRLLGGRDRSAVLNAQRPSPT